MRIQLAQQKNKEEYCKNQENQEELWKAVAANEDLKQKLTEVTAQLQKAEETAGPGPFSPHTQYVYELYNIHWTHL